MRNLPSERVTASRPFYHTEVDYAGPIFLRTSKGRGHKATKTYIAVFVYSLHELHELFTSKLCQTIRWRDFWQITSVSHLDVQDCGTNFVVAGAELRALFSAASATSQAIHTALATDGVEWRFNPPSALHFGGLWEAAVKSVKHHLLLKGMVELIFYRHFSDQTGNFVVATYRSEHASYMIEISQNTNIDMNKVPLGRISDETER